MIEAIWSVAVVMATTKDLPVNTTKVTNVIKAATISLWNMLSNSFINIKYDS